MKDGERLIFIRNVVIKKGNDFKIKEGRLRLDIRKKIFTMVAMNLWHR